MEITTTEAPPPTIQDGVTIAAYDFDGTLVMPQGARPFPKDRMDWRWAFPNVVERLVEESERGHLIVIFSNQTKPWKVDQIRDAVKAIGCPMYICIALDREYHKPSPIMFNELFHHHTIDPDSFYVGDAMGRSCDFADSDLKFAKACGLRPLTPEEYFVTPTELDASKYSMLVNRSPREAIIMVGYPGAGKTTFATRVFAGYTIIHRDELKTYPRMLRIATTAKTQGRSVVFDATNPSVTAREPFIAWAKNNGYIPRCIHIATTYEEAWRRNCARENSVKKMVLSLYRKYFMAPTTDEGFETIDVV
jgi:bifunctional polynucleotide phosphatase/kinase